MSNFDFLDPGRYLHIYILQRHQYFCGLYIIILPSTIFHTLYPHLWLWSWGWQLLSFPVCLCRISYNLFNWVSSIEKVDISVLTKNHYPRFWMHNIYFWLRFIFLYQKSFKRTFIIGFWVQNHLLNLCSKRCEFTKVIVYLVKKLVWNVCIKAFWYTKYISFQSCDKVSSTAPVAQSTVCTRKLWVFLFLSG